MANKETGKIFGLFPVTIVDNVPDLDDCFFNNHFMWLFEILNSIEGFAASLVGVEHYFLIKMDKPKKNNMAK